MFFGAENCGGCPNAFNSAKIAAAKFGEQIKLEYNDIFDGAAGEFNANSYNIETVPHKVLYVKSKLKKSEVGGHSSERISDWIKSGMCEEYGEYCDNQGSIPNPNPTGPGTKPKEDETPFFIRFPQFKDAQTNKKPLFIAIAITVIAVIIGTIIYKKWISQHQ